MFEKVTVRNINKVKKGDVLVKYPAFGEPTEEVDVKDTHNSVVVQVQIIIGKTVGLLLSGSTIPAGLPGLNAGVGPLHKEKSDLVAENTWWLYRRGISMSDTTTKR